MEAFYLLEPPKTNRNRNFYFLSYDHFSHHASWERLISLKSGVSKNSDPFNRSQSPFLRTRPAQGGILQRGLSLSMASSVVLPQQQPHDTAEAFCSRKRVQIYEAFSPCSNNDRPPSFHLLLYPRRYDNRGRGYLRTCASLGPGIGR